MGTAPAAFELQQLTVGRDGWQLGVDHLRLFPGEIVALVGPSGAGKSTLLLGMLGLLPEVRVAGRVLVGGLDLLAATPAQRRELLRRRFAFVLQDARAAADPLVRLGELLHTWSGAGEADCADAVRRLGLVPELLRRYPHQVSGGEAQRVLLAAAWLRQPAVLIADEPTASLDPTAVEEFSSALALLRDRCALAMLVSTHDQDLVRRLGAAPFAIEAGRVRPGLPAHPPWPRRTAASGIGEVLLEARGLTFHRGARTLFAGLDLVLRRGEILAITGPSGSGKTTLAHLLAGRLQPDAGTITRPARQAAVQMLAQDAGASLTPGRPLRSLLAETQVDGFDPQAVAAGLGLGSMLLARGVEALSGGERRRAALLRALSVAPDVLILDEPTASLDRNTGAGVLATLLDLMRLHAIGVVLITHDFSLAEAVADRRIGLGVPA